MKSIREKETFIDLRAKGLSFSKISKEIGVSKPILIKWNREFASEIANMHAGYHKGLLKKYRLDCLTINELLIVIERMEAGSEILPHF